MASFVILLPFTLYIHLLFNDESKNIHFNGNLYEHNFPSDSMFVWFILIKLIPILLYLLWFFSSSSWWRYFILVPIVSFFYPLPRHIIAFTQNIENNIVSFSVTLSILIVISIIITDLFFIKEYRKGSFNLLWLNLFNQNLNPLYKKVKSQNWLFQNQEITFSKMDRLKKLYHTQTNLEKEISTYSMTIANAPSSKKKLRVFIMSILLIVPFLLNVYWLIPEDVLVFKYKWITIQNYGFPDARLFVWYVGQKLAVILTLLIWFITSDRWWRYAILSPIVLFTFQLWRGVQEDVRFIEETEYVQSLPIISIFVLSLILLSQVVKYQSKILDKHEEISIEIEELLLVLGNSNQLINAKRDYCEQLKSNEFRLKPKEQLDLLIQFKKTIIRELEH